MKRFARLTLWALPLVVVSVALWRVVEARSWRPQTTQLFGRGGSPSHLPISWQADGLWLLQSSGGDASNAPPQAWKQLRNWNRSSVALKLATRDLNAVGVVSPTGREVLRTMNESIELWRGKQRVFKVREKSVPNRYNVQEPGQPRLLALAPDGTRWAAGSELSGLHDYQQVLKGFSPNGMTLWDGKTGRQLARRNSRVGGFTALQFAPDSQTLAGVAADGQAFLWEAKTGRERRAWRAHPLAAAVVAWSPDGQQLLTGANPRLGQSRTGWSFHFKSGVGASGSMSGTTTTIDEGVLKADAQNNLTFNGTTDRNLRLWNVRSGKLLREWKSATGICSAAFAPDGRELAVGTHGEALLFDATNWKIKRRFPLNQNDAQWPTSVAWSPDGTTLAVACTPQIMLWRVH